MRLKSCGRKEGGRVSVLLIEPQVVDVVPSRYRTFLFEALQRGLIRPGPPAPAVFMPPGLHPAPVTPEVQGRIGTAQRTL
jgi:hypothetical protein